MRNEKQKSSSEPLDAAASQDLDLDKEMDKEQERARVEPSPAGKIWVYPQRVAVPSEIVELCLGSPVIAELLYQRGIRTVEQVRQFLDETCYVPTAPLELPGCGQAVERILKAIEKKEPIVVYGDYDVDGITGTSLLLTVLRDLGANVDFYIPNRINEGYGLNLKAVSILASKKRARLLITCDCGVSNFAEINFAKSLGVDTLVLDHHTMPEVLPPAVAVVHPKLLGEEHPLYHLPGVGVAYKVCEALLEELEKKDLEKKDQADVLNGSAAEATEKLLDFVTLGMIADLVPLVRENRYLVKIGLRKLLETPRIGLKALLSQVQRQSDTDLVGFGIAPRINAAGRLSDASQAVELLTTDDETVASRIAADLQKENIRRQELCEEIYSAADLRVQSDHAWQSKRCIAIYDPQWHHGVVGIVASRLVEKYNRPVFIGQLDVEEGIVKGSARGVEQLDLYEVLKANEHLLLRWGGHKMAAGFSVEASKADALCRGLEETCARMMSGKPIASTLKIDMLVSPELVSLELARLLMVLAPFGMDNKKPRFCLEGMTCLNSRPLGKEGKHSRIMLSAAGSSDSAELECVYWNSAGRVPEIGQKVDLVFTPEVNHFNNRDRLQLVCYDWKAHGENQKNAMIDASSSRISSSRSASSSGSISRENGTAKENTSNSHQNHYNLEDGKYAELPSPALPLRDPVRSRKQQWKDLRSQENPREILARGKSKLKENLLIFDETAGTEKGCVDRTTIEKREHLMFWQFPPSPEIFSNVLAAVEPANVYLVGAAKVDFLEPGAYLRRLMGLCRYAAREKEGCVERDRLESLMASTRLALALGLELLKQAHIVDWYLEDSNLNVELLDHTGARVEEFPEYHELSKALLHIRDFQDWCATSTLNEIQRQLWSNSLAFNSGRLDRAGELLLPNDETGVVERNEAFERS